MDNNANIIKAAEKINEAFYTNNLEENKKYYSTFKWLIDMYEVLGDSEILYSFDYKKGMIKISRIAFSDGVITL